MALFRQPSKGLLTSLAVLSGLAAAAAFVQPASAQEPAQCLSFNPADWPAPSRPYFMLVVDTSGSMTACTTPPTAYPIECNQNAAGYALNSCGMVPSRINDAKCALRKTVQAFSGEVNFGLATFASYLSGCTAGACVSDCGTPNGGNCDYDYYDTNCTWNVFNNASPSNTACGNFPACSAGAGPTAPNFPEGTWRNGGNVVVGIEKDSWWLPPPLPAPNTAELLQWFDGQCDNSREIFAAGGTPIAGSLEAVTQYLRAGWSQWTTSNYCPNPVYTEATPADTNDRACRSFNVILLTDGDESCDTQSDAEAAASVLWNGGVTIGGKTWKVPVHVINFAGGSQAATNAIAAAGGTSASILANNEVQLSSAFASIIGGAIKPETCNNTDDNCNGCTDEGYKHYCNLGPTQQPGSLQTCCAWTTGAQRTTCLNNYIASITPANPGGNTSLLPCTTATQQTQPANWLCYDPKDVCDEIDNNCSNGVDENQLKCGNPLKCPSTEMCDGQDNDCDGVTDEGVCPNCVPSPEVCDGCDNDCDGVADDGVASIPCGLASPANCVGTQTCKAPVAVPVGTCVAGGGYDVCNNNPQPEICDMIDNDCDGIVDDGVAGVPCVPPGTPGGLNYNPPSQCKMGTQACGSSICSGFIGPSAEVCDGIDNDCDGMVDEGASGVGATCGTAILPCTPGTLACVNGALVCQGGIQPQPEVCDNIDNNCNGTVDDAPLADGPAAGQNGCWNEPGPNNCCSFGGLNWCPPPNGTCYGNGTLTSPCNKGTLVCSMGAWTCQGPIGPSAEVCDNVDNDCDGMTDDVTGVGLPCGTDQGECVAGTSQCSANGIICVGSVGPTAELCDNKDNDCDGAIDDGVPGVGQPCGINQLPCTLGTTACVAGMVVCQGGNQPTGELCDGIDNDCDGTIDEGPLADAPPPNLNGCWTIPDSNGSCGCSFGGYQWCPPPGASCSDVGTLTAPCAKGTLACSGALGWVCQGDNQPQAEDCDGLDNNCDGMIDEGTFPGEGMLCGSDEGECVSGLIDCAGGILDCVGDVGPKQELCNGLDDDCDGTIDNGIVVGGSCAPVYDMMLYPGDRTQGNCKPGILECDGNGGNICVGGTGPMPEVCDGIDNDCDGSIDETGPAPDGIDGTANPLPPPNASIGDLCGVDTGACQQGNYACVNGQFACLGGQGPQEEACDCDDNDCDGTNDEQDPNVSPICAPGNTCVKSGTVCTCALPCDLQSEFQCPPGQKCDATVTSSETGEPVVPHCVADNCGDCTKKTVLNADNTVLCAPAGTPADANCVVPPVCVCKGITGCKNPCDGVTCSAGEICTEYGANAGTCVPNNCFAVPCQGCGQVCVNGSCATNPCTPNSCPNQECHPNADYTDVVCVDSCAGKTCATGEICKDGVCVADCAPCSMGQVCDYSQTPPVCVTNNCTMPCANGGYCDPVTGQCGNDPCAPVVCPSGQVCQNGDCFPGMGGSGGAGGSGGETTSSSSSSSSGMGGTAGAGGDTGIWGLPTGGGGCTCEVGGKDRTNGFTWALAALALGILRRRTTGRRGAKEVSR